MENKTTSFEEYLQRYADMYCNGDTEEARKHEIVRAVEKSYKEGK